jgi:hypothetical protein
MRTEYHVEEKPREKELTVEDLRSGDVFMFMDHHGPRVLVPEGVWLVCVPNFAISLTASPDTADLTKDTSREVRIARRVDIEVTW